MNTTQILSGIYKAEQCCDVQDCRIALDQVYAAFPSERPKVASIRARSLYTKMKKLGFVPEKFNNTKF